MVGREVTIIIILYVASSLKRSAIVNTRAAGALNRRECMRLQTLALVVRFAPCCCCRKVLALKQWNLCDNPDSVIKPKVIYQTSMQDAFLFDIYPACLSDRLPWGLAVGVLLTCRPGAVVSTCILMPLVGSDTSAASLGLSRWSGCSMVEHGRQ